MSQFFVSTSAGNLPPTVAESFVTNNGTAVPAAHVLNVLGGPGISTYASPDGSNNLFIKLENGCSGTVTTTDATPTQIQCIALGAVPGSYMVRTQVAAFSTSPSNLAAGYFITACVRTTGVAGIVVGTPDKIVFEEGALTPANATISVSGNNLVIVVTGVSGITIDWKESSTATFVS